MNYLINISVFLTVESEGRTFSFQKITALDPEVETVLHDLIGFSKAEKAFCLNDNLIFTETEFFSPNAKDTKGSSTARENLQLCFSEEGKIWNIIYSDEFLESPVVVAVPMKMLEEEFNSAFPF